MRKNNSIFSKIFMLATLFGAMIIPSGGCGDKDTEKDNTSGALDRTYTVNRGDLTLGVTVSGTVNARKKYLLRLEANMSTKLLWIIDENTHVKEGDVIARFDSEDLKNKINDLSVEVDNLEKELDVMLQDQTIQESTGAESMRTAHDRLDQALDALRKYRRYELRSSRDDLDTKIQDAEVALKPDIFFCLMNVPDFRKVAVFCRKRVHKAEIFHSACFLFVGKISEFFRASGIDTLCLAVVQQ